MNIIAGRRLFLLFFMLAVSAGCGSSNSSSSSPSAPSPTPTPSPTPSASPTTITIQSGARTLSTFAFVPNPATVSQGAVVTWSNTDTTTHDMVSDTGVWDSGRIAPSDSFKFTFAAKGTYPYHCSIHPGMTGTIVVQ
jgi:plastocyanin